MENKLFTKDQIKNAIWQELKEAEYTGDNNDRAYEVIGIVMAGLKKITPINAPTGPRWVKASERLPKHFIAKFVRIEGVMSIAAWHKGHERFVDDAGDFHPADQVEWLDEQPAALKQIDREWICDALIEFTIAYIKSNNKDIANDAAEYLYDKLKDVGIEYVLSESEQPAAGREEDIAEQDRKDGWELSAHYAHIEACEKKEAVAFVNWTLSSGCDTYTCTDEDQWTNIHTQENITTAELYDIFKKENP